MDDTNLYLGRQEEESADGALERRKGIRRLSEGFQAEQKDVLGDITDGTARFQVVAVPSRLRGILELGGKHDSGVVQTDYSGGGRLSRRYTALVASNGKGCTRYKTGN